MVYSIASTTRREAFCSFGLVLAVLIGRRRYSVLPESWRFRQLAECHVTRAFQYGFVQLGRQSPGIIFVIDDSGRLERALSCNGQSMRTTLHILTTIIILVAFSESPGLILKWCSTTWHPSWCCKLARRGSGVLPS